jgi:hypothetical protein
MNRLAIETVQQIGGYLDASSVLRFSSTHSKYRTALKPLLFGTIRVKFSSPETLKSSTKHCLELLSTYGSFCHVRSLYVTTSKALPFHYKIEDCGDRPLETWRFCSINESESQLVTRDDEWKTLLNLIKSVPALRKLTWGCREQMPPCVLRYIDEKLPQCQVYLVNSRINSLVQPSNLPPQIHPYDIELATSRCIYGIVMHCDYMDSSVWVNYNKQAVIDMVAGATPNLRDVSMHFASGYGGRPLGTPFLYPK